MKIRTISAVAALAAVFTMAPADASAQSDVEVTANAGFVSQYYYRGIPQKTSSASAGLDLAAGAFSAGTWAADVGDGAEVDLYAGVGVPLGEEGSLYLGGTGYFYTGDFDNTYLEGNVGLGFGPVSLEYSLGSYRIEPEAADYSFVGLTLEQNGFFLTGGAFGTDLFLQDVFDAGKYAEGGYGFSAAELDFVISSIWTDMMLSGQGDDEVTLVFGVSKTFDISPGM